MFCPQYSDRGDSPTRWPLPESYGGGAVEVCVSGSEIFDLTLETAANQGEMPKSFPRVSRLMLCAISLDECLVLPGRVNARMRGDGWNQGDVESMFEHAQLFEFFRLFERGRREGWILQKE